MVSLLHGFMVNQRKSMKPFSHETMSQGNHETMEP